MSMLEGIGPEIKSNMMRHIFSLVKGYDSKFGYKIETGKTDSLYWLVSFLNRPGYAVDHKTGGGEEHYRPAYVAMYNPKSNRFTMYALSVRSTGKPLCVEVMSEKETEKMLNKALKKIENPGVGSTPLFDLARKPAIGMSTYLAGKIYTANRKQKPKDGLVVSTAKKIFQENMATSAMRLYVESRAGRIPV
ncbi:hypothetical protein EPN87_00595 [archaeon]|nr:MAG: hypothetical protein EPN87_00595 [archaeon]